MDQRCPYFVSVYNTPSELVVNTNQTMIYLVPTRGSRTLETKGAKHIWIYGHVDKLL